MKKKLVPFNDPAQVSLAFYSIRSSIERLVKATEAQTAALVKVFREQNSELKDLGDVLRATNEILIQQTILKRDKADREDVKAKIETARKRLLRKA